MCRCSGKSCLILLGLGGELGGLRGAALAPYVSHWGAFEKAVLLCIPKGHVPRSQVSSSPWTNSNFNVPTWRRVNSLPANLILGKMPEFFQAAVRINFNVIPQGNQREEKTGNKGRIVATEKKNVLKKKKKITMLKKIPQRGAESSET